MSDIVIANRLDINIDDIKDKVYTRDLYPLNFWDNRLFSIH